MRIKMHPRPKQRVHPHESRQHDCCLSPDTIRNEVETIQGLRICPFALLS